MRVENPASRAQEKDYEQSDLERLMGKQEWRNYDEMIKWLQKQGDQDRRFTPGEVRHMIEDLTRVKQQGKQFMNDPSQLYRELKRR